MKGKFINKPLFNLSRKNNFNLFIIFGVVVTAMIMLTFALFPMVKEVSNMMPAELQSLMVFTDIVAYFSTEALEMWIVIVAIYSAVLAINLTTNEFKNGSFEMLYTLNLSRKEIVRTKLVRLILNTIYLNLIACVMSLIGLLIFGGVGSFNVFNVLIYTLIAIVVTLQIGVLTFSFGLIGKKNFNTFAGVFIVLIMFLFTSLSMLTQDGKLDWIAYLSPISAMKGNIFLEGFKGIFSNGIILLVWTVVSVLILLLANKKFKNDDLC